MGVARHLICAALAALPLRAATASTQVEADAVSEGWTLPAIDALVAGRLRLACEALDAGRAPDVAGTRELLERPEHLHEALLSVLEHGAWRAPGTGDEPWTEHRLEERHAAYVRELARGLPASKVLAHARAELAAGRAPARLRAELALAGEAARARDLRFLCELAAAAGARESADVWEQALLSTLHRDAAACRELDAAWKSLATELQGPALDALAACARAAALPVLAARLDERPELRAAVLARMGALAQSLEEPADAHAAAAVRALLDAPSPALRREAALCAGRLQDAESAPRLVEMLEASERAERDAALWALRRISRLGFDRDPRPWRVWLAEENAWWSARWPVCLAALSDPRGRGTQAALDELAGRRLHRDLLAQALVEMGGVEGEWTERRCLALAALGSRAGLGFLRECLASGEEPVRRAAAVAWSAASELPPPHADGLAARPR